MDFYRINERSAKNGVVEVYPDFVVGRSKDLMVRSRSFYAIWDEERGLWSTDEYDVQRLVDEDIKRYTEEAKTRTDGVVRPLYLGNYSTGLWQKFQNFLKNVSDNSTPLDETVTFSNTIVRKEDYVSKRMAFALDKGDTSAYEKLISTLYEPQERAKLEWAIGAIIAGDAKRIQKFIVLYGSAGSGKSTVLNIIQKLFTGYYSTFEAKALTSNSNAFSTEAFSGNPLVALQHDGDLSRIEDNSKLNSIVSHEDMVINEKFKPSYTSRINAFLFMGTNRAVKITDAKSGIIRRLIDVRPSGNRIGERKYHILMSQIDFELGAIAYLCLETYRSMGMDYYSGYRPVDMMYQTDYFYNFVAEHFDLFKEQDGVSLTQAYELYKTYCLESGIDFQINRVKLRDELKNYFDTFEERAVVDGDQRIRNWYSGFNSSRFVTYKEKVVEEKPLSLVLEDTDSLLDRVCGSAPAQYANQYETPSRKWSEVETILSDIETSQLHYVQLPENHIVIDFDLKGEDGHKNLERNLQAASEWPNTYAELSKGGSGVHLHYYYDGDVSTLSRIFSEGIEIKVFTGNSSLRRRVSKCNNLPISTLSSGLPIKEKKLMNADAVKSEKALRDLVWRNLRKEIHSGTKPSIDFIHKILKDAYDSGLSYDLTDLRGKILAFANNSSNQALYCIKLVQNMHFKGLEKEEAVFVAESDSDLVIFDVEVFPNLFTVCWKKRGTEGVAKMINPTPQQIEELVKLKLVGFNNRKYDNHILYARIMGYDNEQLYNLSKKIVSNVPNVLFGEAYGLSYADIYDFSSKKQSLKKFQIELGLNHKELGLPWDEPVPEEMILEVVDYNANDVITTEQVLESRWQDLVARQILAKMSGLRVNDTTQKHTARIIFGADRKPQDKFVYTDLSEEFPGYKFELGKSTYKGEEVGEGGLVRAIPGMYTDVVVLDIESMHPTTIGELNLFGPYTKNFMALKAARMAIKHKDFASAKKMLGGIMTPYLDDESNAEALSYALKIVINIVYGLTSAKFDNPFRDIRNVDNIVAKRGALFMIDLRDFIAEKGFEAVHIKTDSVKIPGATTELIDQIMEYGKNYGYDFEHEATYEKFCLVNDAVYIARTKPGRQPARWEAIGAQFKHPYVFKRLFTNEEIIFDDLRETKSVTTALHLDFENGNPPQFVGRAGSFVPVTENGALLVREKNGEYHSASGAKGFRWLEADAVQAAGVEHTVDMSYYKQLADAAIDNIAKYGDPEWFRK